MGAEGIAASTRLWRDNAEVSRLLARLDGSAAPGETRFHVTARVAVQFPADERPKARGDLVGVAPADDAKHRCLSATTKLLQSRCKPVRKRLDLFIRATLGNRRERNRDYLEVDAFISDESTERVPGVIVGQMESAP
jgi:hypothetical protein